MRALFILDYANPLYDNGLSPYDDVGRSAFANFTRAALERYQKLGVVWELYNEPNGGFWTPSPNATAYALLAKVVGDTFEEFPSETLMGPAVYGVTSTSTMQWLTTVCAAGGLAPFRAISLHPYRGPAVPETALGDFVKVSELLSHCGGSTPGVLLSSEWGYSTQGAAYPGIDEVLQAKFVVRSFLTNLAAGLPLMIWYDWQNDCNQTGNAECFFGLVNATFYPGRNPPFDAKPGYVAVQTLSSTLRNHSAAGLVRTQQLFDYALRFNGTAGTQAFAVWSSSAASHTISVAVGTSTCFEMTELFGSSLGTVCPTGPNHLVAVPNTNADVVYLTPKNE